MNGGWVRALLCMHLCDGSLPFFIAVTLQLEVVDRRLLDVGFQGQKMWPVGSSGIPGIASVLPD